GGLGRPVRPPRRRRVGLAVVAAVIVLAAVGVGAAYKLGLFTTTYAVPSFEGLTVTQAGTVLTGDHDGFVISVTAHARSSTVARSLIISQTPAAGTTGKPGLVISVTISDGPEMVTVPAGLVGEDCATATQALLGAHLNARCPSSAEVISATVPAGRVVRVRLGSVVNPHRVRRGATLLLVLSRGPATTTTTTTIPGGTTTTTPGTTTTTTLAPGTEAMPNVLGLTRAQVYAAMKAAQLYFSTSGPHANTPQWTTATGSSPAAGAPVKRLSNVVIFVK
ncbi:MAG: PASTA domain-containing protein, partial [Acidimicrobiales bacterium]